MEKDASLIRRAWGCLLGQIAGDSLGSQVEFKDAATVRALYPSGLDELEGSALYGTVPGQPTDDSEMALALARTLAQDGGFDAAKVLEAYKAWLKSRPVDFAHSVFRAMHGKVDARSQSNSALMRVSPLGVFGARNIPDASLPCDDGAAPSLGLLMKDEAVRSLAAQAMDEAALSNPHPLCRVANAAYVISLAYGIRGGGRTGMHGAALAVAEGLAAEEDLTEAASRVAQCLRAASAERPADYQSDMSHVLVALQNGFWQLLHAEDAGAGVRDTAMQGGDAAANCAVAGSLLGAALDIDSFPVQWADAVLACLPEEGRPGVAHPRPKSCWPLDFMPLAEKLLG
ncbi:MAG: ADP-ribosylglycohydrolase family protein [Mailhella sp.]|nr:ADP-ribosylglycohydrolase family protein [Mailhella sp.]